MRLSILLFSLFISHLCFSQNYELKGELLDNEGLPLVGANIVLLQDGEMLYQGVSDVEGYYEILGIAEGTYRMKISYVGFFGVNKNIDLKENTTYPAIKLFPSPVGLDEVVVKGKVPLATQQGDTTSYNASQYKVLADASTEDLVTKMPGVTMENGALQAEGENVARVLVDGKPFFGNDPSAALKNLPAEVVSKIEIFDQKSEQAEFTGFDDGETTKTINIVTKVDKRNGQFGKAYAAFGTENHYNAGGNFSVFNGDRRISFIGQTNDINIQNFSSEDILGISGSTGRRRRGRGGRGGGNSSGFSIPQQPGIAQTHAVGVNFSDQWGDKLEATMSYFGNLTNNVSEEVLSRDFFGAGGASSQLYQESNSVLSSNMNHRINGRFEYKFSKQTSFNFTPAISYQDNDGLEATRGETGDGSFLLNTTDNNFYAEKQGWNINNRGLLRHRFGESRRTISLGIRNQYSSQAGNSSLQSLSEFFQPVMQSENLDQRADLSQKGWNNSANLSFTNPVSEKGMLSVEYRVSLEKEDSDQQTFDANEMGAYEDLNSILSNVFKNNYVTHSGGLGYNHRVGKSMLVLRTALQYATLNTDQSFPFAASLNRKFLNVIPFAMWRYNIDRQNNVRVIYRTNTRKPTLTQLQEVLDNSNPLQLSIGNSNLDQQFQHSIFARLKRTNTEKGTVLFALIGGNITQNYIGSSLYDSRSTSPFVEQFSLARGSQLTRNVNLNGYWDFRTFVTYGMPLYFIKSNLNLNLSANFSNIPGLINEELNNATFSTYGVGVQISSNISEKIDFTIGSKTSYNTVLNDRVEVQNSTFLNQRTTARLNWILPREFVFRTDVNNQYYGGLSDGFNESFWIWNLAIGKKVFKSKLGEVNVSIYDVLNQNQRISREVTGNYIEDVRTNILQRYVMVNFIYNFRNFGKIPAPREGGERGGGRGGGGGNGRGF